MLFYQKIVQIIYQVYIKTLSFLIYHLNKIFSYRIDLDSNNPFDPNLTSKFKFLKKYNTSNIYRMINHKIKISNFLFVFIMSALL